MDTVGKHIDDLEQEQLIEEYMEYLKPKSTLDIGCGKGRMMQYCVYKYLGIDKNKDYIKYAKEKFGEQYFKVVNVKILPFEDKEFDMSFTCTVLMHNVNGGEILKEMTRVTKRFIVLIETTAMPFQGTYNHAYSLIATMNGFELFDYRRLRTSVTTKKPLSLWFFRRKKTKYPKVE